MASHKTRSKHASRAPESRTPLQRIYVIIVWLVEYASWVPSAIGALSAIAAAVCWAMVGDPPNIDQTLLGWGIIFTAVSVLMAFFVEVWRHQTRKAERGQATQTRVLFTDALDPIVDDIARMANKPKRVRETALVKIISNACASVPVALPDGRNLRVIVYGIEQHSSGVRQLVSLNHSGRKDKPGKLIDRPGERGHEVFKMIAEGRSAFEGDILLSTRPGVEFEGKRYRTFISSPIIADDVAHGMVSVDSPSVGSLDENDIAVVEFLAGLIAIAFAEASRPS